MITRNGVIVHDGNISDPYTIEVQKPAQVPVEVKLQVRTNSRRGRHDKEVEIWINSQWRAAHMSNILPGDMWQLMREDGTPDPENCYQCVTRPIVGGASRSEPDHPAIMMGVNKIVQAPKQPELTALPSPLTKPALTDHRVGNTPMLDYDDVDFKDCP